MQKTVQITLDGQIFFIEEEAYQKLEEYLESIKVLFIQDEDQEDIINDIESRIAEIFCEQLSNKKQSLSLSDINSMISQMGSKQDFEEQEVNHQQENTQSNNYNTSDKKLFRDPDDVVLAGVCSGIAAYFGLDPVLIRILFGISIFVYGWGVLFYIFLAIIIPKAQNTSDKLRMKGKPVNLKKIEDEVKQRVNKLSQKKSDGGVTSVVNDIFHFISAIFQGFLVVLSKIIPIISKVIGIIISVITIGLIGLWTFFGTNVLFNSNAPWIDQSLISTIPQPELYILIACLYFALMIPTIAILCLGVTLIKQKSIFSTAGIILATIAWFIAISVGGAIGTRIYPQVQETIQSLEQSYNASRVEKEYQVSEFKKINIGGNRNVKIYQSTNHFVKIKAPKRILEKETVKVINNELRIDRLDIFCFFCFEPYSNVEVEIGLPSLDEIDFSGAVNAELSQFETDLLLIELSGASNLSANIISENVNLDLSGASEVILKGKTDFLSLEESGASQITANSFEVDQAFIQMSGASQAKLFIKDSISGDMSGASNLQIIGEPIVNVDRSGSSDISITPSSTNSSLIPTSNINEEDKNTL